MLTGAIRNQGIRGMICWLLRSRGAGNRPAATHFRFGESVQSHLPGKSCACDSLYESRVALGLRPILRVVSNVRPSTVSQLSRPSLADFRYIGRKPRRELRAERLKSKSAIAPLATSCRERLDIDNLCFKELHV